MDIIKLIIQIANELGPWEFNQVIGILRANNVRTEELPQILRELKPYIHTSSV